MLSHPGRPAQQTGFAPVEMSPSSPGALFWRQEYITLVSWIWQETWVANFLPTWHSPWPRRSYRRSYWHIAHQPRANGRRPQLCKPRPRNIHARSRILQPSHQRQHTRVPWSLVYPLQRQATYARVDFLAVDVVKTAMRHNYPIGLQAVRRRLKGE